MTDTKVKLTEDMSYEAIIGMAFKRRIINQFASHFRLNEPADTHRVTERIVNAMRRDGWRLLSAEGDVCEGNTPTQIGIILGFWKTDSSGLNQNYQMVTIHNI